MKIASVIARQVLDCKARPLLEVKIPTETGYVGRGAAPRVLWSASTRRSSCVTKTGQNKTG